MKKKMEFLEAKYTSIESLARNKRVKRFLAHRFIYINTTKTVDA